MTTRVPSAGALISTALLSLCLSPLGAAPARAQCSEPYIITAPGALAGDNFGRDVAISGDTLALGAISYTGPEGAGQGIVHLYLWNGSTWAFDQSITPIDAAAGDNFGGILALEGDTLAVGALGADGPGGNDQGAVYVYVRSAGVWTQQQKLLASDGLAGDLLGIAVAIDSNTIVAGASHDDDPSFDSGSAYVFVRSGVTWSQQQKLSPPDPSNQAFFGSGVAISGNTAAIGAYFADGPANDQGAAYVYTRSGTVWSLQQKVTPDDDAADQHLGWRLDIEGDTLVSGAYGDSTDRGAVYVFTRSGVTWTQRAKFTGDDSVAGDFFGHDVALSGGSILVGTEAAGPAGAKQGSAYIFVGSGALWTQQAKLVPANPSADDYFGHEMDLEGDTAAIGAWRDDGPAGANQGSVVVFQRFPSP